MKDNYTKEIRDIVTKIFYSPATNGKADESIEKGCQEVEKLVLKLLEEQRRSYIKEIKEDISYHKDNDDEDVYIRHGLKNAIQLILTAPLATGESNYVVIEKEEYDKLKEKADTYDHWMRIKEINIPNDLNN